MSDSLPPYELKPARLLCPWDSLGKNTGGGCHAILQGIFPTQGSNPSLLHLLYCWVGYLPLVPPGKPHLKVSNCQQPSHGLTHAGPSLTRMRLQQREQVLTNEARNSTYSSCVWGDFFKSQQSSEAGSSLQPWSSLSNYQGRTWRPCLPWLWRCCDQAAPHHPAAPPVIYLLHHILLISILCLPLFPQTPITNNPPSLSAHNLVFSWRIKSPDSFLSRPPQSSSFQPSTHSSPDLGPPLYLPSWCSGGLPSPPTTSLLVHQSSPRPPSMWLQPSAALF